LVLALAVFLGWLVKRLGVKRLVQPKGRHLSVVDSVSLGFKRQASLVRVGHQVVLIGVGEHEVTHLGTFAAAILDQGEPTVPALISADPSAPANPPASAGPQDPAFRTLLNSVLKQ
jgi:flagellar biosynthetic protein FliO